jgi:ubiquinone/menaquinone biosynthesis C-methylase UbiE
VDVSEELVKIAQIKYPEKKFILVPSSQFPVLSKTNAKLLPFADSSFDKVFCLAVIHHIPSAEFRRAFLAEAKRVLKPGGLLILTAWYLLDKPKTWRELAKMALLKIAGRNKMDLGDILVPFKDSKGKVLAERYVHTFSVAGLRRLVGSSELRVESSGLVRRGRNRNVEVVGRK